MGKNEASMDYTDQVFLLRTQGRSFNWELPHRPIQTSSQSKGTAFYMKYKNKIHLITCFHCIDDSFYTTVSSPSMGSEEYRCRVKWICPELDLACLEIDPTEKSKANNNILHPKKFLHPWTFPRFVDGKIPSPETGAVAMTVGFPLGQTHLKVTRGIISGQQSGLFQTDAPINGGNSGGPLMWKNKVIGINAMGYFLAQNIAYAIPIMSLLQLIDYHEAHPDVYHIRFPRGWGVNVNPYLPIATATATTTDKKKNVAIKEKEEGTNKKKNVAIKEEGIEVNNIYSSQLMSTLALKKGDRLVSINGMPISSLGEIPLTWLKQRMTFHSLLYHMCLGQEISIEYITSSGIKKKETLIFHPEPETIRYRNWYPEHEDVPYLYLCGMILVPFAKNIADRRFKFFRQSNQFRDENPLTAESIGADNSELITHTEPQHWDKSRIIIINILKGGLMRDRHALKIGEFISSINNTTVSTIEDITRIVRDCLKNKKDIQLETLSGKRLVLPFSFVCTEEKKLLPIYSYTSPFHDLMEPVPSTTIKKNDLKPKKKKDKKIKKK